MKVYVDASPDKICVVCGNDCRIEPVKAVTHVHAEMIAIRRALELYDGDLEVLSDSLICVNICKGEYQPHKEHLYDELMKIRSLIRRRNVVFTWVPRDKNVAGQILEKGHVETREETVENIVVVKVWGCHRWPGGPKHLSVPHFHTFKVVLCYFARPREVDFLAVRDELEEYLLGFEEDFGDMSCEEIAKEVILWAREKGLRVHYAEAWEEEEHCGARVYA